tara:strand:- start:53 stop:622 length:570 start_codon:yes stop_codon:yes gene_type:complete
MLGLFLTCFIISYNCFKDVNKSVKYGFFLLVVLSLVGILLKVNKYTFDNVKENLEIKENLNQNAQQFQGQSDTLNQKQNTMNNQGKDPPSETTDDKKSEATEVKDTFTNKESDTLDKYLDNIEMNDDADDEKFTDTNIIKDMSPAQAQRELYKLIDTTNLLQQTMTEMTPIINEGKKIMKSIDSLNLLG